MLQNKHRVTVEMKPVEGLEKEQNDREVKLLESIKETMTTSDIEKVCVVLLTLLWVFLVIY
jgi:Zn-dependent M16 (insulinase) family peptidase